MSKIASKTYRMAYVDAWVRQMFSVQVIRERKARGWSQLELAKRSGLKQSVVSRIETERSALTLRTVRKLAEAFGSGVKLEFVPFKEII